ncbi:MAG: toll/interleukin-1 receptor domain-containing protein [Cyanobacteria bacterium P01_D01_bin.156]
MLPSLFLSYSRREVAFVNDLHTFLKKTGYNAWLDYHNLIPGSPWLEQILRGISDAEIVLLVVSQSSVGSENVADEWKEAIKLKKRIILIVFEAVELPEPLKQCEWIDFRGPFQESLLALNKQIQNPRIPGATAPEKGFNAPKIVWRTFAISIVISLCSLFAFWTVYIPYHLVPLPYKILKRNFSFSHVQASLLMLPFILLWSMLLLVSLSKLGYDGIVVFAFLALLASIFLAPALLILIRQKGMRRWGKPIASRPKFAKPYRVKKDDSKNVSFTIDSAPEDKRYARSFIRYLERHGHSYMASEQNADVNIVLLSTFKTESFLNPEEQVVYPVILQQAEVTDPRLQRIQWIDFRRGIKNIKAFSYLLSQPEKMVKALGIVPPGDQIVLPRIVQWIGYYLILLCILQLGSLLTLLFQNFIVFSIPNISSLITSASVFIAVSIFLYRSLFTREGLFNSIAYLWMAIFSLGGLILYQFSITSDDYMEVPEHLKTSMLEFSASMSFGIYIAITGIYLFGLLIILLGTIVSWQDLRRWLYR